MTLIDLSGSFIRHPWLSRDQHRIILRCKLKLHILNTFNESVKLVVKCRMSVQCNQNKTSFDQHYIEFIISSYIGFIN